MTSPWDPNAHNPPGGSHPPHESGGYGQQGQPPYGQQGQPPYGQPGYGGSGQPGYSTASQPSYDTPVTAGYGQGGYDASSSLYGGPTPPKNRAPLIIGAVVLVVLIVGGFFLVRSLIGGSTGENTADVDSPTQIRDVDLVPGNCLESMEYDADYYLTQVPCADEHAVEVYAEMSVSDSDYPEFPGEDTFEAESDAFCADEYGSVAQPVIDSANLLYTSLYPSQETWDNGDRKYTCLIAAPEDGHLTGSVIAGDAELN